MKKFFGTIILTYLWLVIHETITQGQHPIPFLIVLCGAVLINMLWTNYEASKEEDDMGL